MIQRLIHKYIKGDKPLWAFILIMVIASFLPVFSASSNLVYVVGNGTVVSHIIKHGFFLLVGLMIIIALQNVNYKYFGGFAVILLPFAILFLFVTALQGDNASGTNASRWLYIPLVQVRFQPSTLASLVLLVYLARYLTLIRNKPFNFWNSVKWAIAPIIITCGLIFPANGSTAIIILALCTMMLFLGNYPLKYMAIFIGSASVLASIFVYVALNYGDSIGDTRVHTWKNRIERFTGSSDEPESYQVKHAKAAIVQGGFFGKGFAKSAFKQTLPQSSSDFIYAIIIEEYGSILGGGGLILLYLLMLYRIIVIATKIHTYFGTLLVLAAGIPVIIQALVNMAVAVNLIPVTGQPLPLISYGGTALWVTCASLGIVLSVSSQIKTKEEIEAERKKLSEDLIQDIA